MRKDAYRLTITDGDGQDVVMIGGPLDVQITDKGWIVRQPHEGSYVFEGRGAFKDIAFLLFLADRLGLKGKLTEVPETAPV